MFQLILCLTVFVSTIFANELLTPCKPNDNDCILKEAAKVQTVLINGYKPFKIPKYSPFKLPKAEIQGSGLYIKFEPVDIYGFDNLKFQEIKFDTDNKLLTFKAFVPKGKLNGPYHLKGKLGPLNMDGQGDATIEVDEVTFKYKAPFDIVEKGGKKYVKIGKTETKFDVKKVHFDFKDIVKGSESLSQATNDALNADWDAVVEALGTGVEGIMDSAFTLSVKEITDHIPLDELLAA